MKYGSRPQPTKPISLPLALERRGWLGKLPERRERNIWWRWWREEPTKVFVPVEIEVSGGSTRDTTSPLPKQAGDEVASAPNDTKARPNRDQASTASLIQQLGLPLLKTQEFGLVRRAEQYAGNRNVPNAPKRSNERTQPTSTPESAQGISISTTPPQPRSVRRRYRDLLSKLPILSFVPTKDLPPQSTMDQRPASPVAIVPGKFTVKLSPSAPVRGAPRNRATYSRMSKEDHEWILRSQEPARERSDA